ncbi:MAG TPA: ATP-binding protein [Caulobacteraceae bacterium]|nr:ATP-binding protein [Caulobacteraceae bacterium]
MGAITLFTTRAALTRQFDARIRSESAALAQEFRTEGLTGVAQAVQERDRTPGALDYGLEAAGGRRIAGRLAGARVASGWSNLSIRGSADEQETIRVYADTLAGGYRLVVGGDDESIEAVDKLLVERFLLAILGVVIIGVVGSYSLGRGMGRRIAAITGAAEAIIDGDLSHRVPVRGSGDDLDHLASTFNRMLDRIQALMESLKQVSSDIAHDLRTPLTRLRTRLESQLARGGEGPAPAIEVALDDLDAILETFAALLRIAQIEGGARRAGFRPTDLSEVGRTVVEAFAPSAEDAGASLLLETAGPLVVDGDSELLTQMVVNLVENGLRHAGRRPTVRVTVARVGATPMLCVIDDGRGVPDNEREHLFDRFYRLERSRSTPGSGLGLALVAAVAKLHDAEVALYDARPGLEARVTFAPAAA